jgi:hypothetical protein
MLSVELLIQIINLEANTILHKSQHKKKLTQHNEPESVIASTIAKEMRRAERLK